MSGCVEWVRRGWSCGECNVSMLLNMVGGGGGEVSQSEAQHTIVTYPHYTIYHIG